MKERHKQAAGFHARQTLQWCWILRNADFDTLSRKQVEQLLACADVYKYQAPKNANGSRARYFHDLMQRRAKWD